MRMWMVDPRILCSKHLGGEHVELHMLVGSILKNKSLDGYVRNNCLEAIKISERHDDLVREMTSRGMKHKSPLPHYLVPVEYAHSRVNKCQSLVDLISRCPTCRCRYQRLREEGAIEHDQGEQPQNLRTVD